MQNHSNQNQNAMERNVLLTNILRLSLASFMFARPAVFPLWEANGFTFADVARLQIYFSMLVVALEIPSGLLGDLFGRKRTLVLGFTTLAVGCLVYGAAHSFTHFVIGEILLAVGLAMISGVDQALLYESLEKCGRTDLFLKHWGRQRTIDLIVGALFNVAGGYVLTQDVRYPFYIAAVGYLIGLPMVVLLAETLSSKPRERQRVANWGREVLEVVASQPTVRWSLGLLAIITSTIGFVVTFQQGYFKASTIPLQYYGWMTAVLTLTAGGTAQFSYLIRRHLGLQRTVWMMIGCLTISLVAAGTVKAWWGCLLFLPLATQKGLAGVVLSDELNNSVPDQIRSTMISLVGLLSRIYSIGLLAIVGRVSDAYGTHAAFSTVGLVFSLSAIPFGVWIVRRQSRTA